MPYFFWKASAAGRVNWLMIWVVYQVTCPSFLAAAIRASSAALAIGADPARKPNAQTLAASAALNGRDAVRQSMGPLRCSAAVTLTASGLADHHVEFAITQQV